MDHDHVHVIGCKIGIGEEHSAHEVVQGTGQFRPGEARASDEKGEHGRALCWIRLPVGQFEHIEHMPTNTYGIGHGLKVKSGFLNSWDSQGIGDTAHSKHQVIKDYLTLVRGRSLWS